MAKLLARLPIVGKLLFDRISKSTSSKSNLSEILDVKTILTPKFMEQVEANRSGLSRLMRAMTISPVPAEQIPAVPVMLLWGEADTVSPLRVGEYLKKTIPGAQLSAISGCGHLPQVEAPEVFASQVSLFLRQLDRGRRSPGAGKLSL
jgi:pimeloyl-ACP methyl ester carboxylesterase